MAVEVSKQSDFSMKYLNEYSSILNLGEMSSLDEISIKMTKRQKRKLESMSSDQVEALKFRMSISDCCKRMDLTGAIELYYAAKASGIIHPTVETLCNLLSLAAGFGDQGSGSGPLRTVEPPSDINAANVIFNDIKATGMSIPESSYTAMIRCCSINNQYLQALELLHELESKNITPKLRTFSPLFEVLSKFNILEESFILYHTVTKVYNLIPNEKDYCNLLKLCINMKDYRFYELLDAMMEDILIPHQDTWDILQLWFTTVDNNYDIYIRKLESSGIFYLNNKEYSLQSIDLDNEHREVLLSQIDKMTWSRAIYQENTTHIEGNTDTSTANRTTTKSFKPLLILHTRHFQFDGLSDKILSIIHSWRDANILYESPAGCNDDWFWLYATVILRCKVLTNDEMRDHHFQMLSPRWFARWKERHQIKYSFTRSFHSNSTSTLSISSTSNMGVGSGVIINNTAAPAADTVSSELIVAAAVDGTDQNLINSSTVDTLTSTSGLSLIENKIHRMDNMWYKISYMHDLL
eukprot:gene11962-25057_t